MNPLRSVVSLLTAFVLSCGLAQAQSYPSKPIRLVVPYVAGGAADITARVVAQKMAASMGVPVVVDNRPGSNGSIGTDVVAKAAPDGYTLLLVASGPLVVNPSLYPRVPYDPLKDLAPISLITRYQYVLVSLTSSPLRSVKDLITQARQHPGELTYGSTGIGGGGHLAGELFGQMTGTKLNHIPYKGNAAALSDVLGGQLSFTFDTVVTAMPHIKSGKLRPLAVTGPARAPVLPQIPTLAEQGVAGYEVTQFQGLLAPAKTDPAIIARLHREVVAALRSPDVVERLVGEGGYELVGSTPQEFAEVLRAETAKYAKLIKSAQIKPE
jgi:tripartite-type tricarboxylate transporter receptor subunit TctC